MGPDYGNVRGSLKNIDFLEFLEMVLRSEDWTMLVDFTRRNWCWGLYVERPKEIIAKKFATQCGDGKSHTTLFLDLLDKFTSRCQFFTNLSFTLGSGWFPLPSRTWPSEQPELAVKIWMHYKNFDFTISSLIVIFWLAFYSIAHKITSFIDAINAKFKVNLVNPKSDIYDSSLFHTPNGCP